MGYTVYFVTLMAKAHKQISAERKERLKPVLNEGIRTLCEMESMKKAKESFRISNSFINNNTTKFQKVYYQSGSKRSFGNTSTGVCTRFSVFHSLNIQGRKKNHQHRGQSLTELSKSESDVSIFLEFLPQYKG